MKILCLGKILGPKVLNQAQEIQNKWLKEKYDNFYIEKTEMLKNQTKLRLYDKVIAEDTKLRDENHQLRCDLNELKTQLHTTTEQFYDIQNKYHLVLNKMSKQQHKYNAVLKKEL